MRLYYIINAIYVHVCTICTCHFKRMYTEEHASYLNSICDNQRHLIIFFILDDQYNMHDMYIYGVYTVLFAYQHSYVMLHLKKTYIACR